MAQQLENMVFEGGGAKACVYIGALRALEKKNLLGQMKRFAGSSAGALFAACACLGYSSYELEKAITDNLPKKLQLPSVLELFVRVLKNKGILDIALIRSLVESVLAFKHWTPQMTLTDVHQLTCKDLVIVSTDLNTGSYVYFHHQTHPTTRLVDAIVCSMAIPIVFRPAVCDLENRTAVFSDPGLFSNNFPVWVFNDLSNLQTGIYTRSQTVSASTLGLRVQSSEETAADPTPLRIQTVWQYLRAILVTIGRINDTIENPPDIAKQCISIQCDQSILEAPSLVQLSAMIQLGEEAVKTGLEKRFPDQQLTEPI